MARAEQRYLQTKELAWFKLARYAPATLGRLKPSGWARLLGDRLEIRRLAASMPAEALTQFKPLKRDPLAPTGYSQQCSFASHETDTASVKSLRVASLHSMQVIAANESLPDLAPYDLANLPATTARFENYAHAVINLRATKAQIKKDFSLWLDRVTKTLPALTNQVYGNKVLQWAKNKYLPYYDLKLYADLNGARIRDSTMRDLLELNTGATPASNDVKAAAYCMKVFTWKNVQALIKHGEQDGEVIPWGRKLSEADFFPVRGTR